MGNKLDSWACPICNSPLNIEAFKNPSGRQPGFTLICNGTDEVPHELKMYLKGFRKDASFLPAPKVSGVAPKTRAASLLARVRGHVEERGENG